MTTLISMLRAVNVGGQTARMADLSRMYQSLGFQNVRTYLQSGNVVFDSSEPDAAIVAGTIETQFEKEFGFASAAFVREVDYFGQIINQNPFLSERNEDPAFLHVTFLYRPPAAEVLSRLVIPPGETAEFRLADRAVYLFCPNGYGRTKLSNTFFERKLAVPATTRNWNTVRALYSMGKE